MPHMNGRDLTERVLAHYPNTKTIVLSAYSADLVPEDSWTGLLLAKPIQPTKLYDAMKALLGADIFDE